MTDGERRCSCNVHVYLFYEPSKKTAISKLRSLSILPFWSASDPRSNGGSTAKSCKEHPPDQTSQVASEVRFIARSTALGRRGSKSSSPTQSGLLTMRVMRG